MPYLRFKGFPREFLQHHAQPIVDDFARVAAVPREKVKIELLSINRITPSPRSVEIYMFQRPQKLHDAIAASLHAILCSCGFLDVHIFFVPLSASLYYKGGEPLRDITWLPSHLGP